MAKNNSTSLTGRFAKYFESLGRRLERGRGEWIPRYGYLIAAKIDLMFPSLHLISAEPFNGQLNRLKLFHAILKACSISTIVETGTFRGVTTEYIAKNFDGKIYSCEVNRQYFDRASARLAMFANVDLRLMQSEALLESLLAMPALQEQSVFFYLDAHWNKDVPLIEEMSLIFNSHVPSVAMIDDFEVPSDPGYGFDTFGNNQKLCLQMLARFRGLLSHAYFPSEPADTETGPKRGSMIFTNSAQLAREIETLKGLVPITNRDWDFYGV